MLRCKMLLRKGERVLLGNRRHLVRWAAEIDEPQSWRETEHREQWCLLRYLCTLAHHEFLEFPLIVERSDRPDYFLRFGVEVVGLEVTNMGAEDYHKVESHFMREAVERSSMSFPPGEIVGPCGGPTESALDQEPEVGWLGDLEKAARKKLSLLPSYQVADDYELLLLDHSASERLVSYDVLLPLAVSRIREIQSARASSSEGERHFGRYSILRWRHQLLFDLGAAARLLPVVQPPALLPCPGLGTSVELGDERLRHIRDQHPDLPFPLRDRLAEVLARPDQIRRSDRSPRALLFSRWYHDLRKGKHLVAVVVRDEDEPPRHWVITAYLARRLSGGTVL